eukprot:jgi/Picre1/33857/NNA_001336.t1
MEILYPGGDVNAIPNSGPAPILMTLDNWLRVTNDWEDMAAKIEANDAIKKKLGWVREMYGFSIAVAKNGIELDTTKEDNRFIVQPPADDSLGKAHAFHYTQCTIFKTMDDKDVWGYDKRFHTDPSDALRVPKIDPVPPFKEGQWKFIEGNPVTRKNHESISMMINQMNRAIETLKPKSCPSFVNRCIYFTTSVFLYIIGNGVVITCVSRPVMPPKEQKQHERLGSLGSMGSISSQEFRETSTGQTEEVPPGPSSTGAVAVKQEPVSPRAQHRKSPQNRTHRRHREVTQDTVTFGGGIGGVCIKGPRRTTTRGTMMGPSIQKGTPGSTQKRGVNMDVPVKKEDIPDMHTSSSRSTSSDSDEEMDEGLYRPTIVQPPADMPRDVGDIDTAEHAEASERISSLFTDASDGNLMLFQLPEKLPIIKKRKQGTDE